MTGLLRHIDACNRHNPAGFRPLLISGNPVGLVAHQVASHLIEMVAAFEKCRTGIRLSAATVQARTAVLAEAVDALQQVGLCAPGKGELFPVVERWGGPVLATIDRSACQTFGFRSFGVHVHGLVQDDSGLSMWIARRGLDRRLAPGALDNMIAGGQPHGLSLIDNLVKEAAEEASLPPELARSARPVGAVSYCQDQPPGTDGLPVGVKRDVLFVYDLYLPKGVQPRPAERALTRARETDDFKFNVPLTLIEFGIRHGLIGPDDPGYLGLLSGLFGRV
jgi:hypothetical protein